jgi:HD-GYP domain-containing protein (c-di-GMP phosphodiesterase class II)
VADLATRLAKQVTLPGKDVRTIYLAGLMHDLGQVGVPSFILEKPQATLTRLEWERLRLHPYHTVRHHLEHIYNKIGVSTRAAATLFAIEHDLLR